MSIKQWIESNKFQFEKMNVRPWGGFELGVHHPSSSVKPSKLSRSFGSAYTEVEAFEMFLRDTCSNYKEHPVLYTWLGHELFQSLMYAYENDNLTSSSPQLPSETASPNVSEHIHNEPNA